MNEYKGMWDSFEAMLEFEISKLKEKKNTKGLNHEEEIILKKQERNLKKMKSIQKDMIIEYRY